MSDTDMVKMSYMYVAVHKGGQFRYLLREHFETYLQTQMDNMSDIEKMLDFFREEYVDAFEWLVANLDRISGIQLYEDGEIRLNLTKLKNGDKNVCIYLSEAAISNRNLDGVLYDELELLMNTGL